jgi:hypothetical protein
LSDRAYQPFAGVFQAELLFNARRAAPWALALLFSANALLWWGWGPAVERGWAVNSEFYIVRLFVGFAFMTLPLFTAMIMGEPVLRDFRTQVDPLIFSKPVRRIEYLAGKFCGNFVVLICCQAAFALTLCALQAFRTAKMIVLVPRLLPYLQHFAFFVVPASLALAAICFTIGTLTRNVKVVYGLAASLYFLYIAWQTLIKSQPLAWRVALDPLLFNVLDSFRGASAASLNAVAVSYSAAMIANRAVLVAVALLSLSILQLRFSTLGPAALRRGSTDLLRLDVREAAQLPLTSAPSRRGFAVTADQFVATLGMELRLLRAERSLVLVVPMVLLACIGELVAFGVSPGPSYAAAYASRTAATLLLFLFAIAVFYTGEAIHRDRELRVQPLLWSAPLPNGALLLAKVAAALLLSIGLMSVVALAAFALQLFRGHQPQLGSYAVTYAVLLVPSAFFMIALSAALSTLLREKQLAFAINLGLGGAFYFLVANGFRHPLYNFPLYGLLTPADALTAPWVLWHRAYTCACGALMVWIAVRFSERKA